MQSVTRSTRTKRVSAGVAAACATAMTAGAMAAGPVQASPSGSADPTAAPAPKSVTVKKNRVPYRCKATSQLVNKIIGGPQRFLVNGKATFNGSFKPGTKVRNKATRITLVMPKPLVRKVRNKLKVKRVRGNGVVKFDVRTNKGVKKMPVRGLKSGWKRIPKKNRALPIPTKGKAAVHKLPKGTKRANVLAPRRFKINARLAPPVAGAVKKTSLNCKFVGKPKKRNLGKFPV